MKNDYSLRRNAACIRSKRKEAPTRHARQSPSMNYNNFSCRVVIPRSPVAPRPEVPRKNPPKKIRRASRPRLATSISVIAMLLGMFASSIDCAKAAGLHPAELRIVADSQTVPFKQVAEQPAIDEYASASPGTADFSMRLESLTNQVADLTAHSLRAAKPAGPMGLSMITKLLLCCGLGVAVAQMRLLFRADLRC